MKNLIFFIPSAFDDTTLIEMAYIKGIIWISWSYPIRTTITKFFYTALNMILLFCVLSIDKHSKTL